MHKPSAAINSVAIPVEIAHCSRTVTSPSVFIQQLNAISSSEKQRERQQSKGIAERVISWFRGKQPEHELQPLFHDGREMSLMTTQPVQQPEGFRCGASQWLGGILSLLVLSATIGGVVYSAKTNPAYQIIDSGNSTDIAIHNRSLIPLPHAETRVVNISSSAKTVSSETTIPECEDPNHRYLCRQLKPATRIIMGSESCYCPTAKITNTTNGKIQSQGKIDKAIKNSLRFILRKNTLLSAKKNNSQADLEHAYRAIDHWLNTTSSDNIKKIYNALLEKNRLSTPSSVV
ncbi:hypothetical protein ACQYRI_02585 [Salmonella enterica]